jgi:ATP-dependent protease ClpP protease subunit
MMEHQQFDDLAEANEVPEGSVLVVFVQDDIDSHMPGKIFFVLGNGASYPVSDLFTLNNYFLNDRILKNNELRGEFYPSAILDRAEPLRSRAQEKIISDMGNDAFDQLVRCKRLVFLINSLGGLASAGRILSELTDVIKENGGTVESYVGSTAMSAAANLVKNADRTIALPDSEFLWHVSRSPEENDGSSNDAELSDEDREERHEKRRRQAKEIQDFFSSKVVGDHMAMVHDRLAAMLAEPTNVDHSVQFTGQELREIGLIETVESSDDLQKSLLVDQEAISRAFGKLCFTS